MRLLNETLQYGSPAGLADQDGRPGFKSPTVLTGCLARQLFAAGRLFLMGRGRSRSRSRSPRREKHKKHKKEHSRRRSRSRSRYVPRRTCLSLSLSLSLLGGVVHGGGSSI
eukprot:COSAG02_NODE_959_length_15647_cov_74.362748_2_plen_111_part_00